MKAKSAILFLILMPAMAWAAGSQPVLTGIEKPVAVKAGIQTDPAISGSYVVYTDLDAGSADVWYFDATDDSLHAVATGAGDQLLPDVSGSLIVYTDRSAGPGDIHLFDIITHSDTNLTADQADEVNATVSSRLVAWEVAGITDRDVVVRDLLLGTTTTITAAGEQHSPAASGSRVVYLDGNVVRLYDADTFATSTVFSGPADSVSIDGSNVAMTLLAASGNDVAVYDVSGALLSTLALAGDQGSPHISGEWVAFEDYSMGAAHVGLWHWTTGDVYYPTPATSRQQLNGISGNRIVYTDDRSGDLDIYMFEFSVASASPEQQITDLANVISAFGLPAGTANSLLAKLQAAQTSLANGDTTAACNELQALIQEAQAQSGKKLTAAQAMEIITDAQAIRTTLGCP